ncbi:zinc finger C2HC domain-containing protein 1C [Danio aesculapii]|uniref:zinc finger C2HC domain-containing protein 1C n=1 Tax=Danio aesculapii TaxID=1142201 RepID=UPI0024C0B289|nr:zinc finger C2HC domain-containing protein 1C [Danio aesculapii]
MQMLPHHHHFQEKETVSLKLPYIQDMSRHHNYKLDVVENQLRKMSFARERRHHPESDRKTEPIHVEEQNQYVPSRRESDRLFPLKPVLHKRAYSLSNIPKPDHYATLAEQAALRHQQKMVRKLDARDQHITARTTSHEKKSSEKHTRLSEEIHSKEMMLQQKIFRAEETVRRVQRERNKRFFEKQMDDRLYSDWYEGTGRYQNPRDDMERWEIRDAKQQTRRQLLTSKDQEPREWDEYTVKDWDLEKINMRREREMTLNNHVRRRREMDREDEELRKSTRGDGSQRRHDRRADEDALGQLSSRRLHDRDPGEENAELLIPCSVCQRCFAPERLETHMRVCEKKRPQRKVFDMSKYRARGTELEEFMKTNSRSRTPERKKNTWRQKHEAFIQTMRQGRSSTSQQPNSISGLHSEYITCPHCGRKFAQGPAERHVPKCQNIKSRPAPPKQPHNSATRRRTTH